MTIPNTKTLHVGQKVTHDKFPSYGVGEIHSFDQASKSILIYWDGPQMALRNKRQFLSLVTPTPKGSTVIQFHVGDEVTHKVPNSQYGKGTVIQVLGESYRVEWSKLANTPKRWHTAANIEHYLADWEKELLGVPQREAELQLNEELENYLEGVLSGEHVKLNRERKNLADAQRHITQSELRIEAARKKLAELKIERHSK